MMFVTKYNQSKRAFERVKLPDNWKCLTFKDILDTTVNCANCGKLIKYADTCVSRELFKGNIDGTGYAVCKDCFRREVRRKEIKRR